MEYNISRRSFMQGAGVVALSIACSGMLTGCGSTLNSSTTVKVGDYKVDISSIDYGIDTGSANTYHFTPTVKFERTDGDGDKIEYSKLFAIYIGDSKIAPNNGSEKANLEKNWFKSHKTETATPKFTLTQDQYTSVQSGAQEIELHVMPYGSGNNQVAIAVYKISSSGKITYSGVQLA